MFRDEYGCDICSKRDEWDNIIWITSSYGVCRDCYDKLSREEIEELYIIYE